MIVLRTLGNFILAIILILVVASVLSISCAIVLSQIWEDVGLDQGVEGGEWVWIEEQPIYYQTWGSDGDPSVVLVHGFYVEGSRTWEAR